jgi:hypothetical protein
VAAGAKQEKEEPNLEEGVGRALPCEPTLGPSTHVSGCWRKAREGGALSRGGEWVEPCHANQPWDQVHTLVAAGAKQEKEEPYLEEGSG